MFTSVSYDDIVRWLATKALPVRIPTLGRRSYIDVSLQNGLIRVHGSNGVVKVLSREYWKSMCDSIDRVTPITDREKACNYNGNADRFAPSVPAICRQYCEEVNNLINNYGYSRRCRKN